MRLLSNLVPCQPISSALTKKAEADGTAMPANQQQRLGRDHSVLLTIVGDSSLQKASPAEPTSTMQHSQHVQHGQHSQHDQHGQHSQHDQHGQHSQYYQHGQLSQHDQDGQHIHHVQYGQHIQHDQHSQHVQHGLDTQHVQHAQHSHQVQYAQHSHHVQLAQHSQHIQLAQHSQHVQHAQHSQHVQHAQHSQQSPQNIMGDPIPVMVGTTAGDDDIPYFTTFVDDGHSPVKVDRFHPLSVNKLRKFCKYSSFWHKIIILRGAGYTKLEIMRALFEHIRPFYLGVGPCKFQREGNSVSFLVRDCFEALKTLFNPKEPQSLKLELNGPNGPDVHFLELELIIRYTHVKDLHLSVYKNVSACFCKRYDKNLGHLDLSAFHDDPDLSHIVFWPLWLHKTLMFMKNFVVRTFPNMRWLNLSNNEITYLPRKGFLLPNLEVLDLSSNKLANMEALVALKDSKLLEIVLDRNPLCAGFADEASYIRCVREFFPCIKKIDGVYLMRPELPVWRQHFVVLAQPECVALVDQFLQHFFTLLDGDDRQRLQGMYHPDAMFSLTCNYVPGQSTSSSARLTRYTLESRNLLNVSDRSKSEQLLSQGAEEVLSVLRRLPRTEHDPYSFAVDMPYYTQDLAMIVVNGVFREPSVTNEKLVRAFSRTFVLLKVASKEYQIINEMLTVSNASTKQAENSFQYPRPKVSLAKLSFNPAQDLTDVDRQQMTKILSRLTEMNQRWSRKFLEESKWDIKEALLVFTELLKTGKFPGEAFDLEEDSVWKK